MDPIENYLTRVSRSIDGPDELRVHLRQELRSHMEDTIEELVGSGLSREEATTRVIASFGEPDYVRQELEAVHGRRHLAFLIEKAMDWRERNMKTHWKWSTAATMLLVLCILLNVAAFTFPIIWILPKLKDIYDQHGAVLPPPVYQAVVFGIQAVYHWIYPVAVFFALWGLFEWRVKSENKPLMRLTGGIALNLILAGLTAYLSMMMMVGLAMAPSIPHP